MRFRITDGGKTIELRLEVIKDISTRYPDEATELYLPDISSFAYDESQNAYIVPDSLTRICLRAYDWAQYRFDPAKKEEDKENWIRRQVSVYQVFNYALAIKGGQRDGTIIHRTLTRKEAISSAQALKKRGLTEAEQIVIIGPNKEPIRMGRRGS